MNYLPLDLIAVTRFGARIWLLEFNDWTRALCSNAIVLQEEVGECC